MPVVGSVSRAMEGAAGPPFGTRICPFIESPAGPKALPFSKVVFSILEPIFCPSNGDLDQLKVEIEQKMAAEEERLTRDQNRTGLRG